MNTNSNRPVDPVRRRQAAEMMARMWEIGEGPRPPAWVFEELPHLSEQSAGSGRRAECAARTLPKAVEAGRRIHPTPPVESR